MADNTTKDLRKAFGNFATGITVITSTDPKGKPQGMTVNSFSTVSLDPPLVSWCIGREATLFELFQQTEHFAVNILSSDQKPISELFASSSVDKFSKHSWLSGFKSLPLLDNCACQLLCSVEHKYAGGDHVIVVGRVIQTNSNGNSPLIYHGGKYKELK
tara:strand:- start:5671 stop:6147 length:477 start_codon:yes stop_codon:yes gene_type:complete